ncbi:hypothetical protein GCM10009099_27400 [Caenispirillum bisanense]
MAGFPIDVRQLHYLQADDSDDPIDNPDIEEWLGETDDGVYPPAPPAEPAARRALSCVGVVKRGCPARLPLAILTIETYWRITLGERCSRRGES